LFRQAPLRKEHIAAKDTPLQGDVYKKLPQFEIPSPRKDAVKGHAASADQGAAKDREYSSRK
jgi:hypothetical protein